MGQSATATASPPAGPSRGRLLSAGLLSVGVVALGGLAARRPGPPPIAAAPAGGGLWSLDEELGVLARVLLDARAVDAVLPIPGETFAILSSAHALFHLGPDGLTAVDLLTMRPGKTILLVSGTSVALGRDRLALLSPDGALRVLDATALPGGDPGAVAPVHRATEGAGPLSVTPDGTVHLLDGTELLTLPRTEALGRTPTEVHLPGLSQAPDALELSSLGGLAVVLDREHRLLRGDDGRVLDLAAHGITDLASARLQHPGPPSDTVLIATSDALHALPWDSGTPQRWPSGAAGRALPPVRVPSGICAVWTQPAHVLWRGDDGPSRILELPSLPEASALVLRAQGDLLLLDDQHSGWCHVLGDDPAALDLRVDPALAEEGRP